MNVNTNYMLTRGTDKLTLVDVEDNTKVTPSEISKIAGKTQDFPTYKADGLNVTLIFHTATKDVVLANYRTNPCLKEQKTEDGNEFPVQLNSTTGGFLPNPDLPLREAAVKNVKYKILIDTPIENEDCKVLENLSKAVETNEGWEKQVCVHTNKWEEESKEKTMCVITAVKHLSCNDEDLNKINDALQKIMDIKKDEDINPRRISQFTFAELDSIIRTAQETYMDTEVGKANKAYPFKNTTALVFNDLSVAAMSFGGSFQGKEFAPFST